jgi:hypothetical protein
MLFCFACLITSSIHCMNETSESSNVGADVGAADRRFAWTLALTRILQTISSSAAIRVFLALFTAFGFFCASFYSVSTVSIAQKRVFSYYFAYFSIDLSYFERDNVRLGDWIGSLMSLNIPLIRLNCNNHRMAQWAQDRRRLLDLCPCNPKEVYATPI